MISAAHALSRIVANARRLPSEKVSVRKAAGRVLGRDCRARDDLPPFDNSAMDGYAVRVEDLRGASSRRPVELAIRRVIRAGSREPKPLMPREAAKIMTGAQVPSGADAVVMQEDTAAGQGRVRFFARPKPGENIRRAGEDVRRGESILKQGAHLRPFEVALLAAQGFPCVEVYRRPRVAVLATGDELAAPAGKLRAGQIRDANRPALIAALLAWRLPVLDGGTARDRAAVIGSRIGRLLKKADVLLVSGGVSVGEFDLCRDIFKKLGVRRVFWKAAIKPGKPLYFGVRRGRLVFGLPGNPVSALVCLYEFVRPALEKMGGFRLERPEFGLRGRLMGGDLKPSDRRRYMFCLASRSREGYSIRIIRPQGAAMVRNVCRANALAVVPPGRRPLRAGRILTFRWLK